MLLLFPVFNCVLTELALLHKLLLLFHINHFVFVFDCDVIRNNVWDGFGVHCRIVFHRIHNFGLRLLPQHEQIVDKLLQIR